MSLSQLEPTEYYPDSVDDITDNIDHEDYMIDGNPLTGAATLTSESFIDPADGEPCYALMTYNSPPTASNVYINWGAFQYCAEAQLRITATIDGSPVVLFENLNGGFMLEGIVAYPAVGVISTILIEYGTLEETLYVYDVYVM